MISLIGIEKSLGVDSPPFEAKTIKGEAVNNSELSKYQATVLHLVAPNCRFCLEQAPAVEEVRKQYSEKNVRFVTVIQKMGKEFTPAEAEAVFTERGLRSEFVIDFENKFPAAFKRSSYPTIIILDKHGRIVEELIGATAGKDVISEKLAKAIGSSNLTAPDDIPPPFEPQTPPVVVPEPAPSIPVEVKLTRHFGIKKSKKDEEKTEVWSFGSEYKYISHYGFNPNTGGKCGSNHYFDPATNSIVVSMWKKAEGRPWGIGERGSWIGFDIEVTLERR